MQVTCPNCGARYAVDPLAIGPVGRIVQCARCANRWLQTVAAAIAASAARQAVESAMSSPLTAPDAASAAAPPDISSPPSGSKPASTPTLGTGEPFESVPDLVIRPPRQRTSLPAVIAPRRPLLRVPGRILLVAIGGVAIVVLVAVGIYFFGGVLAKILNLHA